MCLGNVGIAPLPQRAQHGHDKILATHWCNPATNETSPEQGIWTTRNFTGGKLSAAFDRYRNVIVIFALTQPKIVFGYVSTP